MASPYTSETLGQVKYTDSGSTDSMIGKGNEAEPYIRVKKRPAEGRICQASLDPHADGLEEVSLKIIVLEMYGHLDPEEYLWSSGLVIEADHSKSAPVDVVWTAREKIKTGI